MAAIDEIRDLLQQLIDTREPRRLFDRGLLGDGRNALWVPNDGEHRVWFRKDGQDARLLKVYCKNARAVYDCPVICGTTPEQPNLYQVLSWDWEALDDNWQGMTGITHHAETHNWGETLGGDDPVMVWQRAMMPMRVTPQVAPDLTVRIEGPQAYLWGTGWNIWAGDAILDLTASVPGAGLHRYSLISIDGATNLSQITDGGTQVVAVTLGPGDWPAPPAGSIPLGLVHLTNGMTEITEAEIVDGRMIVSSGGGSLTPADHTHSAAGDGGATISATTFNGIATVSAVWTHSANLALDDGVGDSPELRFIGGSNDDTIRLWLSDDAVAGRSDLYLRLCGNTLNTFFGVQDSAGNNLLRVLGDGSVYVDQNTLVAAVGLSVINGLSQLRRADGGTPSLDVPLITAATNSVQDVVFLTHTSSGATLAGFGARIQVQLEDSLAGNRDAGAIDFVWADPTAATITSYLLFNAVTGGGAQAPAMRLDGTGCRIQDTNAAAPTVRLEVEEDTALTNAAQEVLRLIHRSANVPAAGFGLDILVRLDDAGNTEEDCGALRFEWTDAGAASEDSRLAVRLRRDASAISDLAYFLLSEPILHLFYTNTAAGANVTSRELLRLHHYDPAVGTPGTGFGGHIRWEGHDAGNNQEEMARLSGEWEDATGGAETSRLSVQLRDAGAAVAEVGKFTHYGLDLKSSIWRMGEVVLDLDFTGTDYDTVAECNAVGLRFSDSDTPFPTAIRFTCAGTWGHTAATGWLPAPGAVDTQGPAILIPLCRSANWELEIGLNYNPTNVAHLMYCVFGYVTNGNHIGSYAAANDSSAAAHQLVAYLVTNDGDDTFTVQYTGAALAGTGSRVYRFRKQNSCFRVWDEQDDAWHDYQGRHSAWSSYTASHAFIQFTTVGLVTFARTYLESLKLTYLL